ncbi:acyl--CoA ligase [Bradyrhizobium sp. KBS0727]|uniref:class I adenylate-forming enzyme family protein n=1 Tax=unclassified Bradyrhizobium TaxID=2631580 RepID=UPI00110D5750|nr:MULTISPECIES: class I adenylate-forming enzyme family protein [unclassified Bradyrhizobium]QDW39899.1 acyl--CoA ligase [Bradyrhizobium sp. KBS0725]QDW46502.1 acyl--CoA ligase [Bradyrhizobium sp. KBS0727]
MSSITKAAAMHHTTPGTTIDPARGHVFSGRSAEALLASMPPRLAKLVERWAAATPNRPALIAGKKTVTYTDFWQAIGRAKDLLTAAGVVGGDRVMIVNENSIAAVTFIFAASDLDAWASPINARMSAREIDACRAYSGCRVVVYTVGDSPPAAGHAARVQAQIHEDPVFGKVAFGPVDPDAQPEPVYAEKDLQTAVLLFSSGTTGAPKGVMLSHQAIMYMGANMAELRNITPDDTFYNITPVSHVIGLGAMLTTAIWAGGTTELVSQFRPDNFVSALKDNRVTYVMGVPTIFARVLEYARSNNLSLRSDRLRFIAVGGMPLDLTLKAQVEEAFGLELGNSYGMTEIAPVTRSRGATLGRSVGEVQPGIEVRIIREDGTDASAGEPGEIWVKGPNLMLGYYKTQLADNEIRRPGGFITTGDIGSMDQDGNLSLVGRTKDVIIRSGFNVYPIEVEAVLSQVPDVALVAVVGRAVDGNEEVVAYVQPVAGRQLDVAELDAWARENLTAYKRPSEIILTHELPIGPTGKILKSKLRR